MAEIFDGASVTRVEASSGSLGMRQAQLSPEIEDMKRDIERNRKFGEEGAREKHKEQPPAPPKLTGLQLAQAAEQEFSKTTDPKAAIGQFTPRFDEAMKQSRQETREAARHASAAMKGLAGDYVGAQAGVAISNWLLKQAVASVDPQDLESVQDKINTYKNAQMQRTQDDVIAGLSKKYPQVADALKGETKAASALEKAHAQEQAVWTKLESAMDSQIQTEEIVVDALRKSGNDAAADVIHSDGIASFTQMLSVEGHYESAVAMRATMMYQQFLSQLQRSGHPQGDQRPGFDI